MKNITQRQQEILDFIMTHFRQENFWPSIREIQFHFGFKSTNAVMGHLRALEKKGCISRDMGRARTFKVNNASARKPRRKPPLAMVDLPIYGNISAGYPDRIESGEAIGRMQIDVHTAGICSARRAFALKVRGESMIDAGIMDGDLVIIEQGSPRSGDIVAALIDGETTLKRFIQKGRKTPYLKAENSAYPDMHPVRELEIQGLAKAVVRNL